MGGHWPSLETIALGQSAVVAVLLVTQFVPQPHVSSGVADQGGLAYGVPLASFVVMAVSLAAGFGMLLTGAPGPARGCATASSPWSPCCWPSSRSPR